MSDNKARALFKLPYEDLKVLVDVSNAGPIIGVPGATRPAPQAAINKAWETMGKRYGFKWNTVRPMAGMTQQFFTAELDPSYKGAPKYERRIA